MKRQDRYPVQIKNIKRIQMNKQTKKTNIRDRRPIQMQNIKRKKNIRQIQMKNIKEKEKEETDDQNK